MKKIAVVGVGGRTGTMFSSELKNVAEVFGVGRKREVDLIKNKKLFVKKRKKIELFEEDVIEDIEFLRESPFDFLFLTVKNPVGQVLKYYYQKIREKGIKPPTLFLSQNGIEVGEEVISVLKEIFGKSSENIKVFRISLFNPIDKKVFGDRNYIIYSLPIRMAISKVFGPDDIKDIIETFKKANFEITLIPQKEAKNMEYSKLLLNLIGMASATKGFSPKEGFSKKETFEEEIGAVKEYLKVVKAAGGKFLNFPHYPVNFFSLLFSLPVSFLFPFRKFFAKSIEKGRMGKQKDLDEIGYYNGAVVKLGERFGVKTPINKKILERVKL
ncbi:hypothetical protein AMJ49_00170 [Parcubacteria bacterium DG_74_2]|nr:MAG: hypothetical protein AMJ49_00170 [Parcubacteria bacterium DG_74_2]